MELWWLVQVLIISWIAVILFGAIIVTVKAYIMMDRDNFKNYKRYSKLKDYEQSQVDDFITAIERGKE